MRFTDTHSAKLAARVQKTGSAADAAALLGTSAGAAPAKGDAHADPSQ